MCGPTYLYMPLAWYSRTLAPHAETLLRHGAEQVTRAERPAAVRCVGPLSGPCSSERQHCIWVPYSPDEPSIVILVLEQPVDLYVSVFYGEAAPADFSARPDA